MFGIFGDCWIGYRYLAEYTILLASVPNIVGTCPKQDTVVCLSP